VRKLLSCACVAAALLLVAACSSTQSLPAIGGSPASAQSKKVPPIATASLNFDDYGDPCSGGTGTVCSSSVSCPSGATCYTDGSGYGGNGGYNPGCPLLAHGRRRMCLSGGGGGGVYPRPTPTPVCGQPRSGGTTAIDNKGNTTDGLISGNSALKALVEQIQNAGYQVSIQSTTLPSHEAATATVQGAGQATIQVDPNQMNAAESNGQDATQIMYHEFDHIYYQTQSGFLSGMPATVTFTLGGTAYTYDTANVPTGTPHEYRTSQGEGAWEHMLIHNDLVSAFGADNTGALTEGLQGANNPPANPSATAETNRSTTGTSSRAVTAPSKTASCKTTATVQANAISDGGNTYIDSGLSITY